MLNFIMAIPVVVLTSVFNPAFGSTTECVSKLNENALSEDHLSRLTQADSTGDFEAILMYELNWIVKPISDSRLLMVTNPTNPNQVVVFQSTSLGSNFPSVSESEAVRLVQSLREQKFFVLKDVEIEYQSANSLTEADVAAIQDNRFSLARLLKRKGWTTEVLKQGTTHEFDDGDYKMDWVVRHTSPNGMAIITDAPDRMTKDSEVLDEIVPAIRSGNPIVTKRAVEALKEENQFIPGKSGRESRPLRLR